MMVLSRSKKAAVRATDRGYGPAWRSAVSSPPSTAAMSSTGARATGPAARPCGEVGDVAGVVAVLGGSGGVGASTFAAALATAAGRAVLVDCDPLGGGIDVLLGVEAVPGARWSGLRVNGGRLDPHALDEGLPRWRDVRVLAADAPP